VHTQENEEQEASYNGILFLFFLFFLFFLQRNYNESRARNLVIEQSSPKVVELHNSVYQVFHHPEKII